VTAARASSARAIRPAGIAAAAGALLAAACAGTPLGSSRAGNAQDVVAALAASAAPARRPVNARGAPLAFVATTGPGGPKLIAFDLAASQVVWTQPAELLGRVVAGRSLIVQAEKGGSLVARDVQTGNVRWESPLAAGVRRKGYAVDGDDVYQVLAAPGGGKRNTFRLQALDGATGAVRWNVDLPGLKAGGPAVRGGLVAVPARSQYVSLIDGKDGSERALILSREEAATFVRALPEGLFYGSKGVFAVSAESADGTRKSPAYFQANLPTFVRATYHWDMYYEDQTNYTAIDRNRLLWRAEMDGPKAGFANGMVVVHNFRFFFGFDAKTGDVRWAYNHPRVDAVASEHTGGSVVFVAADGEIGALDAATGQRTYSARIPDAAVRGATFDAEGFAPASPGGAAGVQPLSAALASVVWDPDRRYSDVKIFAVDQLARQPGRDVTGQLLKILGQEGVASAIYQKAAEALVARKDRGAADLYIKALEVRTDYIAKTKTHGLDVLAKAAGVMQAKEMAPALVAHLGEPDTGLLAIAEIAEALVAMDARESLPALRDFLCQYRADPVFARDPAALIAVAEAILKLGRGSDHDLLLFVAEEPKTLEALRTHLRRALFQTARSGRSSE